MRFLVPLTMLALVASCEQEKKPVGAPVYFLSAADRKAAIDQGTSVGERIACGCTDGLPCEGTGSGDVLAQHAPNCSPTIATFALRRHCRADTYAAAFLNEDAHANRVALAVDSCECFVATHATLVKGHTKHRAELTAKVLCGLAGKLLAQESKP